MNEAQPRVETEARLEKEGGEQTKGLGLVEEDPLEAILELIALIGPDGSPNGLHRQGKPPARHRQKQAACDASLSWFFTRIFLGKPARLVGLWRRGDLASAWLLLDTISRGHRRLVS
jgi:hypothetical protein